MWDFAQKGNLMIIITYGKTICRILCRMVIDLHKMQADNNDIDLFFAASYSFNCVLKALQYNLFVFR